VAVVNNMNRDGISAILFIALFAVSLYFKIPIWLLFLILALAYGYKALRHPKIVPPKALTVKTLGVLGHYAVDEEDPADLSYGLYIQLHGRSVFIDLKEDNKIEERKKIANFLHEHSEDLQENLQKFIDEHPKYQAAKVASIGVHSRDLNRREVFWEPDGYTLLNGLEFVDA
jgi:hypothetical protein